MYHLHLRRVYKKIMIWLAANHWFNERTTNTRKVENKYRLKKNSKIKHHVNQIIMCNIVFFNFKLLIIFSFFFKTTIWSYEFNEMR